jgi:hypothetical protein
MNVKQTNVKWGDVRAQSVGGEYAQYSVIHYSKGELHDLKEMVKLPSGASITLVEWQAMRIELEAGQ